MSLLSHPSLRTAVVTLGVTIALGAAIPANAASTSDSVTYTYDALGRIATATYANGTVIQYNYDLANNRLAQQITCGSNGC